MFAVRRCSSVRNRSNPLQVEALEGRFVLSTVVLIAEPVEPELSDPKVAAEEAPRETSGTDSTPDPQSATAVSDAESNSPAPLPVNAAAQENAKVSEPLVEQVYASNPPFLISELPQSHDMLGEIQSLQEYSNAVDQLFSDPQADLFADLNPERLNPSDTTPSEPLLDELASIERSEPALIAEELETSSDLELAPDSGGFQTFSSGNAAPVITDFTAIALGGDTYRFTGFVIDENPDGLTVTFSGLLAGQSTQTYDPYTGEFSFDYTFSSTPQGFVYAQTVDDQGASSNVASYYLV